MSGADAAERFPLALRVRGYFDPLLAAHAERLEELAMGGTLVVHIEDPPEPLLPAISRGQLVSGLAVVGAVVLPGDGEVPETAVDERDGDVERRSKLIERVHGRHAG